MKIRDLMTQDVLTVAPEASLKEVAAMLVAKGISGMPVRDEDGTVLGVVSEGDIIYKEHDPSEAHYGPLGWLVDGSPDYAGRIKSQALTARRAMTSPAVTISPDETVAQAARLMCERRVNRLPVVEDGRLVGIVTRADLVRAFIRSDEEVEREVREDVLERVLWVAPGTVDLAVVDGVVKLAGRLRLRSDVELLLRLARRVAGVAAVDSTVVWQIDDRTRAGRRALGSTRA